MSQPGQPSSVSLAFVLGLCVASEKYRRAGRITALSEELAARNELAGLLEELDPQLRKALLLMVSVDRAKLRRATG